MTDMNVLTVGLRMVDDLGKMFVMRYISSRNWTIPSIVVDCELDEENDSMYLRSVFNLIPGGVHLISLTKIVDCRDKESIKSDDGSDGNSITVIHHSVIFEARVEVTKEHSLSDVPLKFDYVQWIPQESMVNVPFTNRITQKLIEYDQRELLPMVLSRIV